MPVPSFLQVFFGNLQKNITKNLDERQNIRLHVVAMSTGF